jgi:hypothetical protein
MDLSLSFGEKVGWGHGDIWDGRLRALHQGLSNGVLTNKIDFGPFMNHSSPAIASS